MEVKLLSWKRLVTDTEILEIRLLYAQLKNFKKVARIVKRSPRTVSHYLKSTERMT